MSQVVDASTVVAALVDAGPVGEWALDQLTYDHLVAPHLLPAEVANVLRRAEHHAQVSSDVAALAYADLADLAVDLVPFEPFAERIWQLRTTMSAYDAWYVAVAEAVDGPLATLDRRLTTAPGARCAFTLPPWSSG